ncbi:MAG: YdcF family protein [Verrucomicrobiota bacterium]
MAGLATAWIVNEPLAKADAIVVLGGGLEYRPFAAARLFREGVSQHILVTQPELSPTAQAGLVVPEFDLARQLLLTNGVAPGAIQALGTNVTSTRDEALALAAWVRLNHARSVLIPTDVFHSRRVRWIFSRALRGTGARVCVTAIEPTRYQSTNWWQHEEGLIGFQNEVVKSAYYHLKY